LGRRWDATAGTPLFRLDRNGGVACPDGLVDYCDSQYAPFKVELIEEDEVDVAWISPSTKCWRPRLAKVMFCQPFHDAGHRESGETFWP
jgi:hypothetical protein